MGHLLTANEAAIRLGVDVRTLYAYVSRGSLSRRGTDTKRRSLYDADEVELLARRGRPRTIGRSRAGIDVVIGSAVSTIGDGWIRYRGEDPIALAADGVAFERVATLLWTGALPDETDPLAGAGWVVPASLARALTRTHKAFEPTANINARMAAAIAVADAHLDAARDRDAAYADEFSIAHTLVAVLAAATSAATSAARNATADDSATIAERLWHRLSPLRATPPRIAAMNRALVLLADHELATSTLAVRIATSTRASLGCALLSGLATLSGPAHGGMATMAHNDLLRSEVDDRATVEGTVSVGGNSYEGAAWRPGFGHPVHAHGDPRAEPLLVAVKAIAGPRLRAAITRAQRIGELHAPANSDFALGALCYAGRMAPGSAEAIFAVARSAGWIAHAMEESAERPLRFRGRAVPRLPAHDQV